MRIIVSKFKIHCTWHLVTSNKLLTAFTIAAKLCCQAQFIFLSEMTLGSDSEQGRGEVHSQHPSLAMPMDWNMKEVKEREERFILWFGRDIRGYCTKQMRDDVYLLAE